MSQTYLHKELESLTDSFGRPMKASGYALKYNIPIREIPKIELRDEDAEKSVSEYLLQLHRSHLESLKQ